MEHQFVIAHLSDLHISITDQKSDFLTNWNLMLCHLKQTLIDYVVVTGDIAAHSDPKEYELALKVFDRLLAECYLERNQILFCPGNHDANDSCVHSSFSHYNDFVQSFYGEDSSPQMYMDFPNDDLTFWSFNTNTTASSVFYNDASIPEQEASCFLKHHKKERRNILLFHHPLSNIPDDPKLKELCLSSELILCGHSHPNAPSLNMKHHANIVTGLAITPGSPSIRRGFQMVYLSHERSSSNSVSVHPVYL